MPWPPRWVGGPSEAVRSCAQATAHNSAFFRAVAIEQRNLTLSFREERPMAAGSVVQTIKHSFAESIGDIIFGMEDGTVSIFGLVFGLAVSVHSTSAVFLARATGAAAAAVSRQEIRAAFTICIWQEEEAWFALWEAAFGDDSWVSRAWEDASRSGTASADGSGGIPHVLTKRATGGRQPGGSPTPATKPVEPSKPGVYPMTADKLVFH